MASICEDSLLEVFIRLPVETLFRFQLVCKRWKSLILSPFLNDLYLSQATTRRSFKLERVMKRYAKYDVYDASKPITLSLSIQIQLVRRRRKATVYSFDIVGSVQGVVCFEAADSLGLAILWNPFIHKHIFVPIQNQRHRFRNKRHNLHSVLGFGFRCSNNDFRLLRVKLLEDNLASTSLIQLTKNYEVFSVKGESWTQGVFATDVYKHFYMDERCHTVNCFTNGKIHLLVADKMHRYWLLVFDCEQDEFSIMELPDTCMSPSCIITLWRYEGKLAVLKLDYPDKFAVWVMKEYGVSSSWYKQFQGSCDEYFESYALRPNHHLYSFMSENLEESMCLADLEGRVLSSFNSDLFPDHDGILLHKSDVKDNVLPYY